MYLCIKTVVVVVVFTLKAVPISTHYFLTSVLARTGCIHRRVCTCQAIVCVGVITQVLGDNLWAIDAAI